MLTSSQMLGILSVCQLSGLTHLEIEYEVDEEESDLLRSLAALFPRLPWLQIHRYHAPSGLYDSDGNLESVSATEMLYKDHISYVF